MEIYIDEPIRIGMRAQTCWHAKLRQGVRIITQKKYYSKFIERFLNNISERFNKNMRVRITLKKNAGL